MPYTPPSISPSGLHLVLPVKSSYSYAGLANDHVPSPSLKQPPRRSHSNHHSRHANHHRRSSGPTSPLRVPIPVASFAQDRPSPTRLSPVRRTSSSSTDSDEDEDNRSSMDSRHYRHLHNIEELRDAIREQLPQHKAASPPGSPDQRYISDSVLSPTDNLSPLVPDSIGYDSTTSDGEHSSSTTPPDVDIDFPRMVRKKSGEIVKPSLKPAYLKRRPLSLPSTPVCSKVVHFDTQLEHVRHFLHSEKPLAVSTNTSPSGEYSDTIELPFEKEISETQYQIELPNFPKGEQSNRRDLPVHVESVFLASNGRNLIGNVIVKNLAFHKWVAVKFTFDHWQTVSEVSATYDSTQNTGTTPKDPDWDPFTFNIKLVDFTNLENRQMYFCVRYNVCDGEYWDNNYGSNYLVEFRKRPNYLLRSSHPPEANGVSRRASDDSVIGDDFDIDISPETFAKYLAEQITSPRSAILANLGESAPYVKKPTLSSSQSVSSDLVNGTPQKRPIAKAFSNRYNFEASLSAAIANANVVIGAEMSGLQKTSSPKLTNSPDSYFSPTSLLFRPPVQSPIVFGKEDNLLNNIKKSHLSGLQQTYHFRSRSYPLGSPAHNPTWIVEDAKERYNSDDGADKPPMDSSSYNDFISNYCFFEPGKSEIPRNPVIEKKEAPPTSEPKLAPPQFPSIRATAHSPPPSPRKLSPLRTKFESKPTRFSSYIEYTGSSDSSQSSPDSSTSSTPQTPSPRALRSPERSRDHSRESSPSMRFHHHPSPLGFDISGAPATALVR